MVLISTDNFYKFFLQFLPTLCLLNKAVNRVSPKNYLNLRTDFYSNILIQNTETRNHLLFFGKEFQQLTSLLTAHMIFIRELSTQQESFPEFLLG